MPARVLEKKTSPGKAGNWRQGSCISRDSPDLARKIRALKLWLERLREEQFEQLEVQFQRALTPTERKWLRLADELLNRAERDQALQLQEAWKDRSA